MLHTMKATEDVCIDAFGKPIDLKGCLKVGPGMVAERGRKPDWKRILVKFEHVPSNCTNIQWAKMYMYLDNRLTETQDQPNVMQLQVHQVKLKELWRESQDSYQLSGVPWTQQSSDALMDHPIAVVSIFKGRPSGYIEFDITEAAHNWKAGQPNYGVMISAVNEVERKLSTWFFSHRHNEHRYHPFMTVFQDLPNGS